MVLERFGLDGKVAIVTGGGTNLGKAMCHALARAGADLVVAARSPEPLAETVREVTALGRAAIAVPTDVTDSAQVARLVDETLRTFGKIDVLICNAGVARGIEASPRDRVPRKPVPIWELTDEMWRTAVDVNLTGTFFCCRAVARHMLERGEGKIINMASLAGIRAAPGAFTYCSSKAGVIMLTKTLAVTWARHGICVNAIAPGLFASREVDPAFLEKQAAFLPLGRCGEPRELGPLAVFLASSASDYVSGECFIVDGARSAAYAPVGYAPPWAVEPGGLT
ncbi:MAG: SDR family oxidoreductase [Deltaproteobacteria bacterium]|nr:SDR family oxidoreductase [Deltaproteobacteria bacterium]